MTENTASKFYEPGLMDLSRYRLVRADLDSDWDTFVARSEQGTLFSQSVFLSNLKAPLGTWYCLRGEAPAAAIAVVETEDGKSAIAYPNVIHNGVMFAPAENGQNPAQVLSEQFRILAFIAESLPDVYQTITMTFQPSLTDLRPFLWHNYHEEGPTYAVDLRYTNILDLADYRPAAKHDDMPGYKAANKSRRQELRYALKKGYTTTEQYDPDLFLRFYKETYNRQGIDADAAGMDELPAILDALHADGCLRMFVSKTADGIPAATAIFGRDSHRWYYLYGARNHDVQENHAATLVLWDGFTALADDDLPEVDLEGVNSPRRGYFKLSFGGRLTPYYRVRYPA